MKPGSGHPWRGRWRRPRQLELFRFCRLCDVPQPMAEFRHANSTTRACRKCRAVARRKYDKVVVWSEEMRERRRERNNRRERPLRAPRRWWTVERCAAELGLTPEYVRLLCHYGTIRSMIEASPRGGLRTAIDPESAREYDRDRRVVRRPKVGLRKGWRASVVARMKEKGVA